MNFVIRFSAALAVKCPNRRVNASLKHMTAPAPRPEPNAQVCGKFADRPEKTRMTGTIGTRDRPEAYFFPMRRLAAKKSVRIFPHGSAITPRTTSVWWFSRGSPKSWNKLSTAPALGSSAP